MADPMHGASVVRAGASLDQAAAAVILLHGRGAAPEDMIGLARVLDLDRIAWLAPAAGGHTWYPASFLADPAVNAAGVASGHAAIERLVAEAEAAGLPPRRIAIGGFSQGACLAVTHAARHPRAYGAVVGLTGGLIGPPGTTFAFEGSLAGAAVLLASGDPDPHVPWARVEETAAVLEGMGATVQTHRYPGRPHTVSREEATRVRDLLQTVRDAGD
jgi:predicted esterase